MENRYQSINNLPKITLRCLEHKNNIENSDSSFDTKQGILLISDIIIFFDNLQEQFNKITFEIDSISIYIYFPASAVKSYLEGQSKIQSTGIGLIEPGWLPLFFISSNSGPSSS